MALARCRARCVSLTGETPGFFGKAASGSAICTQQSLHISSTTRVLASTRGSRRARAVCVTGTRKAGTVSAKRAGAVVAGKQAFKRGRALENRVARILKAEGRAGVRTNVTLVDPQGHRSEVDVMHGRWFKTYIECKNYSSRPVPLHDVAKFKAVLELNGIPPARGIVVAPSGFTPRCRTLGIRCIGGKELDAWEAAAKGRARRVLALQLLLSLALVAGAVVYQAPFLLEVAGVTGREAEQAREAHRVLMQALATVQDALQR